MQCVQSSSQATLPELQEESEVGDISSEPSFYSVSSVISGSSHIKSEEAEVCNDVCRNTEKSSKQIHKHYCDGVMQQSCNVVTCTPWKNASMNVNKDNQYHLANAEIHPTLYKSNIARRDLGQAVNSVEDETIPQKLLELPRTEYIIVDIPLQMGMGSPYSSSCFILIDR